MPDFFALKIKKLTSIFHVCCLRCQRSGNHHSKEFGTACSFGTPSFQWHQDHSFSRRTQSIWSLIDGYSFSNDTNAEIAIFTSIRKSQDLFSSSRVLSSTNSIAKYHRHFTDAIQNLPQQSQVSMSFCFDKCMCSWQRLTSCAKAQALLMSRRECGSIDNSVTGAESPCRSSSEVMFWHECLDSARLRLTHRRWWLCCLCAAAFQCNCWAAKRWGSLR